MRKLFLVAFVSFLTVACATTSDGRIVPCPEAVIGAAAGAGVGGAVIHTSRAAAAGAIMGAVPYIMDGCDSLYESPYPQRIRISGRGETVAVEFGGSGWGSEREILFQALAPLLHARGFYPVAAGTRCGRHERCRASYTLRVVVSKVFSRGGYYTYTQYVKYRVQIMFVDNSTDVVIPDGTAVKLMSIRSSGYYGYGGNYGRSYYSPETEAALRALPYML